MSRYEKTVEHLRNKAEIFKQSCFSVDGVVRCFEESADTIEQLIEELKQYKDKEEQGLLISLPCKVGDTVWYVHRTGIDEVEVDSFVFNVNLFVNASLYIRGERFGMTLTPYKTLFFTRSEAEEALARMKGE